MAQKPHERITELKRKADQGPPILQHGFRPFFLLAGVWATLAIPVWVANLAGLPVLPPAVEAFSWHRHEMLFGFAAAAIAGFLLTAIPNWTGNLPVSGWRLAILVGLWILGRIAFLIPDVLGPAGVAVADLAFLAVLIVAVAGELAASKQMRNLPVLALVLLLGTANLLVHVEAIWGADTAGTGYRLAIFVIATLLALIGGRVIPSFTRNWLAKRQGTSLPAPFDNFDKAALAMMVLALAGEVAAPDSRAVAGLVFVTGCVHAVRLARWRGFATVAEPILVVLHVGYAWLVVGLILLGVQGWTDAFPASAALHAITVGAFGTMILAVASRAALGHTGRPIVANGGTVAAYGLITVAAAARVISPFLGDFYDTALWISAAAWTLAFGLFTVVYFPILTQPRAGAG